MKTIRVVLSCNSPIVCEGIISLLQKEKDMKIVAEIDNSALAIKSLGLHPDVILLDSVLFQEEELLNLVHELKSKSHRIRILLVFLNAVWPEKNLMQYMMQGVDGYVKSAAKLKNLVDAIRTVHAGNIWAERRLLDKFVRDSPHIITDIQLKLTKLDCRLTPREKDIVSQLFLGLTNKHISQKLHISERTVKTHLNNIFKKMRVCSRTQAISALICT
jgi:two-component system, NarL family, response regulator DegU